MYGGPLEGELLPPVQAKGRPVKKKKKKKGKRGDQAATGKQCAYEPFAKIFEDMGGESSQSSDVEALLKDALGVISGGDQEDDNPAILDAPTGIVDLPNTRYKIQISFRRFGRGALHYSCSPQGVGDVVMVPGDRGCDVGTVTGCVYVPTDDRDGCSQDLVAIRRTTPEELVRWKALDEEEQQAKSAAQIIINKNGLQMSVRDVEYQFDKRKLTIYYRAENSGKAVRFRPLLPELYAAFKCRIWFSKIA